KSLVAEIAKGVAVKFIASALCYDVDDAAGGAAVFRVVVAQDELKLLHALLGNRRADPVNGVVDGVGAVHADHIAAGPRAGDAQPTVGRRADRGGYVARG